MVGDVAYFGSGNNVEADISVVSCVTQERSREEEEFLLGLRLPFLSPIDPTRAFPVSVPVVAVPAFKGLPPVRNLPLVALFAVIARPQLQTIDVFVADLYQHLSLTV